MRWCSWRPPRLTRACPSVSPCSWAAMTRRTERGMPASALPRSSCGAHRLLLENTPTHTTIPLPAAAAAARPMRMHGSEVASPSLARWRRCRVHPGRHAACTTADCRAEEVRLSLPGRDGGAGSGAGLGDYFAALAPDDSLREPVWGGCSASQVNSIWSRFEAAGAWRGACVPFGDKRSTLLRHCGPEQALADGEFFWPVADLREVGERDPERNCTTEHGASANGWSCSRL
mmetsp:Transcript_29260/g.97038  ORF Transcript_29260/g.97038 Transcript_29260/m.97038 type:complete len:231 (-) Transcript_29260:54-746(-)